MNSKIESLKDNEKEMKKCQEKPLPQSDLAISTEFALKAQKLVFGKLKPKYNMGVDCHNGNAAFVVMRKDGEVMEYGNGKDDETFKEEVERSAKYYNIQQSEILKETD